MPACRIERDTNILTGLPSGVAARDLVRAGWHVFYFVLSSVSCQGVLVYSGGVRGKPNNAVQPAPAAE